MALLFIQRPVLASVISILLVLLGLIGLKSMPRTLFPSIAPPEVNVTVEYTGANAETVAKAAIVPLERAINGVPGMKYMSSDTGNDGVGVVQVLFETGTDPDVAAINVQNRVNSVMGELPVEVIRNGVKIAKEENAILLYLSIISEDPEHDEKFLYNFADINILAELKRINGVGYADILGAKEYAMRVWLQPDRMVAYGISPQDVLDTLEANNVEAAPGKIGENSDKANSQLQYTVRYRGKFSTPAEYENLPIRSTSKGEILRIKDVASVELGTTYFDVEAEFDGKPCAAILLKQLPGSNASAVIAEVKTRLERLKAEVFLPGMDYRFSFDVSRFLDASTRVVLETLLEAFLLVSLVVFAFLQNWRSTLIPALAVPVSLIGTFFFIQFLGFSLNLITLFALVLAIGIVVDNAIVVVEAVHSKMSETSMGARQATELAMKEITAAIVAITLVMACVFVPVAFMGGGPSGVFYREFSITMAVAITLSGLVALTLTPALCARLLRGHEGESTSMRSAPAAESWQKRTLRRFDEVYTRAERGYVVWTTWLVRRRVLSFGLIGLFLAATGLISAIVPVGFIPAEDQGMFYASVTTPAGATLERTKEVMNAIEGAVRGTQGIESIATLAGTNVLSDGTGASYGTALFSLLPWDQRSESSRELIDEVARRLRTIQGAEIELFPPPPIPGYGNASGFELRLLDKTGAGDFAQLQSVVDGFVEDLRKRPEIASAFTIFNASYPQYSVEIDLDRAAQRGVSVEAALGTLQTLLGSEYATNFIRFGQMYKVMVQASPEYRAVPEALLAFQVANDRGELVPLGSFVTLEKTQGVDQVTRYNMYPSAELNGEGKPGVSSGTVLMAIEEVARAELPRGYSIDWAGISRDERHAGREGLIVFWICLIFVYLVLAAQYESFLLPMTVVLSLPPGVFGAFLSVYLVGLENNIYTHVALLMLVGLLGKNAILIVEYAEQRRRQGSSPVAAAVEGARLRLRPILMTSFAFVAGLVPLAFASGAGAVGNRTIGTAAAGGMITGTVFGLLLVPGLYAGFATLAETLARNPRPDPSVPTTAGRKPSEEVART